MRAADHVVVSKQMAEAQFLGGKSDAAHALGIATKLGLGIDNSDIHRETPHAWASQVKSSRVSPAGLPSGENRRSTIVPRPSRVTATTVLQRVP